MAVIAAVDRRVTVLGVMSVAGYTYGPTPSMAANAVQLTGQVLTTIGATTPRVGLDWDCRLGYVYVSGGLETAIDLGSASISATASTYYDPITGEHKGTFTAAITGDGSAGTIDYSFTDTETIYPGLWRFKTTLAWTNDLTEEIAGWLEILPAHPSAS